MKFVVACSCAPVVFQTYSGGTCYAVNWFKHYQFCLSYWGKSIESVPFQVFPIKNLQIFSEDELERLLCGENNSWEVRLSALDDYFFTGLGFCFLKAHHFPLLTVR